MRVLVAGLNHKSADVEVREKLAFGGDKLEPGLRGIRGLPGVSETIIVSTCNRVEIYAGVEDPEEAAGRIKQFISSFHSIPLKLLDGALYFYSGPDAVRHIFRVASSLDSMVVGEPQILGQVKGAFAFALDKKATGVLMNKLLKKAISVAKRVRTETKVAENAVSISFAAVELAKKIFNDLTGKSVLLLGAGEMAELAAKHLINSGVREIAVANRTFERGQELARAFNGRPVRFEGFKEEMFRSDIVLCSTGAAGYVLHKQDMHNIMKGRRQEPVFLIDISVPRNIDPKINGLENVYLYDVDDLQGVVDANRNERGKEAEKAEKIIGEEVESFERWLSSLQSVPAIVELREKAEEIRKCELARLFNKLQLGEKEQKAVEYMASAIVNKLIHPPTAALKEDAVDRELLIETIRKLYGLNGDCTR
ncbi:MAG: glutamyl-tRNA reductase [Nitrospiraceae bacterium]|nr:glutamyl-tRNA reductase [Nitrospiraceae bacterium]